MAWPGSLLSARAPAVSTVTAGAFLEIRCGQMTIGRPSLLGGGNNGSGAFPSLSTMQLRDGSFEFLLVSRKLSFQKGR
jgi:hypothetical protein